MKRLNPMDCELSTGLLLHCECEQRAMRKVVCAGRVVFRQAATASLPVNRLLRGVVSGMPAFASACATPPRASWTPVFVRPH